MKWRGRFKPSRPITVGKKWLFALAAFAVLFGGVAITTAIPNVKISAQSITGSSSNSNSTTPEIILGITYNSLVAGSDKQPLTSLTYHASKTTGNTIFTYEIKKPADGSTVSNVKFKFSDGSILGSDGSLTVTDSGTGNYLTGQTTVSNDWLAKAISSSGDSSSLVATYDTTDSTGKVRPVITTLVNTSGANDAEIKKLAEKLNATDQAAAAAKQAEADKHNPEKQCENAKGPIQNSICQILVSIGNKISDWVKSTGKWATDFIAGYNARTASNLESWVANGWNMARNLVNIIAVLALILVAFANILHINLNTYAVKRMLPLLIGAVIAANLSLFAIKAVSGLSASITFSLKAAAASGVGSLADSVTALFVSLMLSILGWGAAAGAVAVGAATGGAVVAIATLPLVGLVALVLLLVAALAILAVGFLMLIQPGVVGILTIFAPLALVLMALPFGQGIFKKWLGLMVNWIFMLPVALILMSLMNLLKVETNSIGTPDDALKAIFAIAGQVVILIMAIRMPFTMGGDIAKGWAAAGTYLGKLGVNEARQRIEAKGAQMVTEEKAKGLSEGKGSRRYRFGQLLLAPSARVAARKANIEARKNAAGTAGNTLSTTFEKYTTPLARLASNLPGDRITMEEAKPEYRATFLRNARAHADTLIGEKGFEKFSSADKIFEAMINDFLRVKSLPMKAAPLMAKYKIKDNDLSEYIQAAVVTNQQLRRPVAGMLESQAIDNDAIVQAFGMTPENIQEFYRRGQGEQGGAIPGGSGPKQQPTPVVTQPAVKSAPDAWIKALEEGVAVEVREMSAGTNIPPNAANEQSVATAQIAHAVGNELRISDEEAESDEEGRMIMPVKIISAPELQVVDIAVQSVLSDAMQQVSDAVKKSTTLSDTEKTHVQNALEQIHLDPRDVNQILDEQGRIKTPDGGRVKLDRPTDLLFRKFVLTATRGHELTGATAENFYKERLENLTPFTEHIAEQVNSGSLKPNDIPNIEAIIKKSMGVIDQGKGLTPGALRALRTNLERVDPGLASTRSIEYTEQDLYRRGGTVVQALQKFNPEVRAVLEKGGNPQQVQEIIVKQAAQGLVRETAVDRINSVAAQVTMPAEEKAQKIAWHVTNYAKSSATAQQWTNLGAESRTRIAKNLAAQVARRGQVDDRTMNDAITQAVRGAAGAPPATPAQPTPPAGGPPPTGPATVAPIVPPATPTPPAPTPPAGGTPPPATPPKT